MALTQVDQGLLGSNAQYTGFKNRIINGAMMIDQRASGPYSATPVYTLDRWMIVNTASGKFTAQQSSSAPPGFSNSLLLTSSSAYSVGASDYFLLRQPIEGFNTADFSFGTANAKTVTLSFWVQSSLTGTFSASIYNSAGNRCYPFSYTISSANTWAQISVSIPGDQSGTWVGATNGIGLYVNFNLGVGSTYSGAANTWGTAFGVTGANSLVGTNGATMYITGVQLEKGSTATSFDYRPYGTELQLCQRYYYRNSASAAYSMLGVFGMASSTTALNGFSTLPVTMRSTPSVSTSASRLADASTGYSISSYSVAQASTVSPEIVFVSSGLTTYRTYYLQASNNTAAYVDYSAEL